MACRIAGRLSWGGGPLLFPSSHRRETLVLQECERDQRHQRVSVQAAPGAALEVVEAEFLLELLVRLLANPAPLDCRGQFLQSRASRQVGEIVLPLARRAMLAHKPDLLAWHVLGALVADALWRAVGDPHPHGRKAGREPALGAPLQLTRRHATFASMLSAETESGSGMCR